MRAPEFIMPLLLKKRTLNGSNGRSFRALSHIAYLKFCEMKDIDMCWECVFFMLQPYKRRFWIHHWELPRPDNYQWRNPGGHADTSSQSKILKPQGWTIPACWCGIGWYFINYLSIKTRIQNLYLCDIAVKREWYYSIINMWIKLYQNTNTHLAQ